jgi:hypothetical protein
MPVTKREHFHSEKSNEVIEKTRVGGGRRIKGKS